MAPTNLTLRSALAAQFSLIPEGRAVQPEIRLPFAPDNVRGLAAAVSKPLRVLAAAGETLAFDVRTFLVNGLAEKEETTAVLFVRAAHHYANSLICSPYNQIKSMLSDDVIETQPTLREQLDKTAAAIASLNYSMKKLRTAIETAMWEWSPTFLATVDLVPSASPYQLLFEALFAREDIAGKLFAQDDRTLLLSLRDMELFSLVANPMKLNKRPSSIGDGRPTMVFASIYEETN
ncbi:hypothetical protein C8A00DRAFT_36370, partial [Chaetomidium leptoderma]